MLEKDVDWTPLADIKPSRIGSGYSMFTAEEAGRIKAFYMAANIPILWVARYFKVHPHTLYKAHNKITTRFAQPVTLKMTDTDFHNLWKRHEAGASVESLAAELGCSYKPLTIHFKRLGLPVIQTIIPRDEVARLTAAGYKSKQIAEKLGCLPDSVRRIRRQIREGIIKSESTR